MIILSVIIGYKLLVCKCSAHMCVSCTVLHMTGGFVNCAIAEFTRTPQLAELPTGVGIIILGVTLKYNGIL